MFRFVCFYCQKVLKTREDKAGVIIHCPRCKKPLQVPVPPGGGGGERRPAAMPAPAAGVAVRAGVQAAQAVPVARMLPPRKRGGFISRLFKLTVFAAIFGGIGYGGFWYANRPANPEDEPEESLTNKEKDKDKEKEKEKEPSKKEVADYIAELESKDMTERLQAAAYLEKEGIGGKDAVKPLVTILKDKSSKEETVVLKRFAASALGKIGSKIDPKSQEELANQLRPAVRDETPEVRLLVLEALGMLGKSAVPSLRECLTEQSKETRVKAAAVLAGMGERGAVADILKAITLSDPQTKIYLASHAVKLDPSNEMLIPILLDGLKTSDIKIRIVACNALGQMGKVASATANALYQVAIKDRNDDVRAAAADALEKVRDDK